MFGVLKQRPGRALWRGRVYLRLLLPEPWPISVPLLEGPGQPETLGVQPVTPELGGGVGSVLRRDQIREGRAGIHGRPRRAKTLGAASQLRISSPELRRHQRPALSTPRGPGPITTFWPVGAKSPQGETDRQARRDPALTAAPAPSTGSSSDTSSRPLKCLLGQRPDPWKEVFERPRPLGPTGAADGQGPASPRPESQPAPP